LIAVVVIVALSALAVDIGAVFNNIGNALGGT
jgi:Flp pilus assembly pilin Flp